MIKRLEYAAALAYSPRGSTEVSRKSRTYRDALKGANPAFLNQAAAHVARQVAGGQFSKFFGSTVTLVPVPGSAPRRDKSSLWVAQRLCQALRAAGLGGHDWSPLRRETAVAKSAFAARGERPSVQNHIESLQMDDYLAPSGSILLIDDVVTKGRTLIACASVIQAAIPSVNIRAFALIRTMGLVPDIAQIVDPVVGEILWDGDTRREP